MSSDTLLQKSAAAEAHSSETTRASVSAASSAREPSGQARGHEGSSEAAAPYQANDRDRGYLLVSRECCKRRQELTRHRLSLCCVGSESANAGHSTVTRSAVIHGAF